MQELWETVLAIRKTHLLCNWRIRHLSVYPKYWKACMKKELVHIHSSPTRKKLERNLHLLNVKSKLYIYVYKELVIIHIKWNTSIYCYVNAIEDVEKENSLHCWWEYKLVQPPWETVWMLLIKLKIKLPYYPAIQCLVI